MALSASREMHSSLLKTTYIYIIYKVIIKSEMQTCDKNILNNNNT